MLLWKEREGKVKFMLKVNNGEESYWKSVASRICQRSVLGPGLFVCYVNNLPLLIHNETEYSIAFCE